MKEWKKKNPHNETGPMNIFNIDRVKVGNYTYGGLYVYDFNNKHTLTIGNYCSIASEVMFILDADHNPYTISTFPFKVKCLGTERYEAISKGDIVVGDDVWIGFRATILSGVHIGQGAIVASGAIVTKDVPPYAIVGGIPAKVIKYRFDNKTIDLLKNVDFGKLDKNTVEKNIDDLYKEINTKQDVLNMKWLPKKNDK